MTRGHYDQLLRQTSHAFRQRDVEVAGEVWLRDDEVDALYQQVFRRLLLEMVTDKATVRLGKYLLWVAHNFERMADRVTNIAEQVAFAVTGDVGVFRERLRSQTVPT
jgi:phosphate transport system protein